MFRSVIRMFSNEGNPSKLHKKRKKCPFALFSSFVRASFSVLYRKIFQLLKKELKYVNSCNNLFIISPSTLKNNQSKLKFVAKRFKNLS